MKIITIKDSRPHLEHGSVVLVLLIFLTLMGILCAVTWKDVYIARQEVFLIEKHQVDRLAATTNAPPASVKPPATQ